MKNFNISEFRENLFTLRDVQNKNFSASLLPGVDEDFILGIKIDVLRKFTRKFFADTDAAAFLNCLPHEYYEENLIHALIVSAMQDYAECLDAVKKFLPYLDNWGVCDSFIPKIFSQHTEELEPEVLNWLQSDGEYIVRFGLSMLMRFYPFDAKHLELAAGARCEKYYSQMMAAWYFATALGTNFDAAVIFLKERRLPKWIHNKTIQKALESSRVSDAQKKYLRGLRICTRRLSPAALQVSD